MRLFLEVKCISAPLPAHRSFIEGGSLYPTFTLTLVVIDLPHMRYFFVLGTNPELSAAEILASIDQADFDIAEINSKAIIIDGEKPLNTAELMAKLGGTIKIGTLIDTDLKVDESTVAKLMSDALAGRNPGSKVNFGLSVYSLDADNPDRKAAKAAFKLGRAGMKVKRILKDQDISSRWVRPKAGADLTSVQVEKNGMLKDGIEFVAFVKNDRMLFGQTTAVQNFEEFSDIDFGRPSRDTYQGMLPPKLARMMLNIAGTDKTSRIWDPFCGSGTILTEAMRIGLTMMYGSDKNPNAIKSTEQNIAWLQERYPETKDAQATVFENDSRRAPKEIEPASLDAIVAEPYLGQPRTGRETKDELVRRLDELTTLYIESLKAWTPLLKDDASVVLALPMYVTGPQRLSIKASAFEEAGFKTEHAVPPALASRMQAAMTGNKGMTYGREDQKVWRDVVRLKRF
jgi:tRNA G10  N-methylase Trm11